tara:strand:- start:648 stop:875 length:228 start_codon:yes stop_codon:yes gene_type:complete
MTDINRKDCPHRATVTFDICIKKINKDGTFADGKILKKETLKKYGITNKAEIVLTGHNEAHCIKILKERLDRLNG